MRLSDSLWSLISSFFFFKVARTQQLTWCAEWYYTDRREGLTATTTKIRPGVCETRIRTRKTTFWSSRDRQKCPHSHKDSTHSDICAHRKAVYLYSRVRYIDMHVSSVRGFMHAATHAQRTLIIRRVQAQIPTCTHRPLASFYQFKHAVGRRLENLTYNERARERLCDIETTPSHEWPSVTLCRNRSPRTRRTSRVCVCVHVVTPVWVYMCVCAVRLESFDVNKLCHCFVRPLSPKQHIISLLQGLFLFLSVPLASLYEWVWTLFLCLFACTRLVRAAVWECDLHRNFYFFPFSVRCSAELEVTDCLCKAGSLWRNWSALKLRLYHAFSLSLIHLNLSRSSIPSFTHFFFFLTWPPTRKQQSSFSSSGLSVAKLPLHPSSTTTIHLQYSGSKSRQKAMQPYKLPAKKRANQIQRWFTALLARGSTRKGCLQATP